MIRFYILGTLLSITTILSAQELTINYEILRQVPAGNFRNTDDQQSESGNGLQTIADDRDVFFKDSLVTYEKLGAKARLMRRPEITGKNFKPPFEELVIYNINTRTETNYVTMHGDDGDIYYRTEEKSSPETDWKWSDKTKKFMGLSCTKATVTTPKDTYTVWVAKDSPFNFSPILALTPDKGLVVKIEGTNIAFSAIKMDPVIPANIQFSSVNQGTLITQEELMSARKTAFRNFNPGK